MTSHPDDLDQVWDAFHQAVNMTSRELRDWLHSEPAQTVPAVMPEDPGAPETGHRVAEILTKRKQDLSDGDVQHMRRVIDFVNAQVTESPQAGDELWRHRLMTVGHDPLKPA
jgi:hypothetical protein